MRKYLHLSGLLILSLANLLFARADSTRQTPGKLEKEITVKVSIKYLLYLPKGYDEDDNTWPLVLFLHGSGERGDDLESVKRLGLPMLIEQGKNFPFILVSPQCPLGQRWDPLELSVLLDKIEEDYRVDTSRVYITGLSMGGEGTWKLAFAEPHRFAAIAPVCGRTDSYYLDAGILKNMPTWVFHGAKDDVVPITESERLVNALKEAGSTVKFTIYPEANHNAWTETYNNEELYKWLLAHKLGENN